ncbi:hypothetical protein Nepgr_020516 [Nepenthes gracilis]|uniref:TFIIS N-terminal domain-containing protein n=1 Tax=Nepenthes gracilis TaxID=150966 RepID=A0AAD3XWC5_NEPGR|nr:hypothetical protein Nepgr_020516 [Nepenthes gracilis]
MAAKSSETDHWRDYFQTTNSDIFDIIENAIIVAASDYNKEFIARRGRIAGQLLAGKLTRSDGIELQVPDDNFENGNEFDANGSNESKASISRDHQAELNVNQLSDHSNEEAEALTDEIEEENRKVAEVLKIKLILQNFDEQSDTTLFDLLRRLQLMALNVDILRETEIGRAVNGLRKKRSKHISNLARELIKGWKASVDEWLKVTEDIVEDGKFNRRDVPKATKAPNTELERRPLELNNGEQKKVENVMKNNNNTACLDEEAIKLKLEASKRKLQERYQEAENAKRQRTIRVVPFHDLPKQGLEPKKSKGRFGNHSRYLANGRRYK